jgi:autoinducer 2-degrading protein
MIVNIINIWVKLEHIDSFIDATIENHNNSVKEPGILRFDVLQDSLNPEKFTLYEVYLSEEDVQAHKETKHFNKWINKVEDYMVKPRERITHNVIAPKDNNRW